MITTRVIQSERINTTEWKSPQASDEIPDGRTISWSNRDNIFASDDARATHSAGSLSEVTRWIVAQDFDFSEIPDNAEILGVTVGHESSSTNFSNAGVILVNLSLAGNVKTSIFSGGDGSPTIVGGSNDVWGASLTPAIVKGVNFGVALRNEDAAKVASIDHIQMRITYKF